MNWQIKSLWRILQATIMAQWTSDTMTAQSTVPSSRKSCDGGRNEPFPEQLPCCIWSKHKRQLGEWRVQYPVETLKASHWCPTEDESCHLSLSQLHRKDICPVQKLSLVRRHWDPNLVRHKKKRSPTQHIVFWLNVKPTFLAGCFQCGAPLPPDIS